MATSLRLRIAEKRAGIKGPPGGGAPDHLRFSRRAASLSSMAPFAAASSARAAATPEGKHRQSAAPPA